MKEEVIQEALRRFDEVKEENEEGGVFFGGRVITDREELESVMREASGVSASVEQFKDVASVPDDSAPGLSALTARLEELVTENATLKATIGELPDGAHPDELKPRDVSFMKERENHLAENQSLREHIEKVEAEKETLTGKVASLTEEVAALKKAAKAKPAKPAEENADAPPATENPAA